jgi:hypothetical protein
MSSYAFIVILIILIYAYTFIKIRRNKKDTRNIDSVRDFHKRYSAYNDMHRRNYSDSDNDVRESVHRDSEPVHHKETDYTYHYLDKK